MIKSEIYERFRIQQVSPSWCQKPQRKELECLLQRCSARFHPLPYCCHESRGNFLLVCFWWIYSVTNTESGFKIEFNLLAHSLSSSWSFNGKSTVTRKVCIFFLKTYFLLYPPVFRLICACRYSLYSAVLSLDIPKLFSSRFLVPIPDVASFLQKYCNKVN